MTTTDCFFSHGKDYAKEPHYFSIPHDPRHYAYLKIAEGCDKGCSFADSLMRGLKKEQNLSPQS
ncbi:MAG: hypothetical protein CM15mP52_1740 [Candidatus Neomarinimicrobiota bacterium]|nr:MAG: hypothetical protein CM15mP52_1740 [Candidatus Neomarinimicrobiota bacterium]